MVRGVVDARAEERVYLYTGNDDHIVLDSGAAVRRDAGRRAGVGALSWRAARALVGLDDGCGGATRAHQGRTGGPQRATLSPELLALDARVTDCNAAFFDVANQFHGCIAGCHEVLRRQGLLEGTWCLDPAEGLGPGQAAEIDRVYRLHGDLSDDAFVRSHLEHWLA